MSKTTYIRDSDGNITAVRVTSDDGGTSSVCSYDGSMFTPGDRGEFLRIERHNRDGTTESSVPSIWDPFSNLTGPSHRRFDAGGDTASWSSESAVATVSSAAGPTRSDGWPLWGILYCGPSVVGWVAYFVVLLMSAFFLDAAEQAVLEARLLGMRDGA